MKNSFRYHPAFLVLLWLAASVASCSTSPQIGSGQLPAAQNIQIDGQLAEWEGQGLLFPLSANYTAATRPADFSATVRLGWQPDGLLFAVQVADDTLREKEGPLLGNDALEIFLSAEKGSKRMVQYIIAPGIAPAFPQPRVSRMDYTTGQTAELVSDLTVRSAVVPGGYTVEGLIPFSALEPLGFTPKEGAVLAVNFYVNDRDGEQERQPEKYGWHHYSSTYFNHDAVYELVLAPAGAQTALLTRAWLEDTTTYHLHAFSAVQPSGPAVWKVGEQALGTAPFVAEGALWHSQTSFPKAGLPQGAEKIAFYVGEARQPDFIVADVERQYVRMPAPNRFEKEIGLFEKKDREAFPPAGATLFVGSSSIRLWPDLAASFPELTVIQRGFGGSKTDDVLHFFDRIVTPYRPATIVYFAGTNDLVSGSTSEQVAANTLAFVERVGQELPGTKVIILSNNYSVSRRRMADAYRRADALIQDKLPQHSFARMVDVTTPLLQPDGIPNPAYYVADSVHLNPEGYRIWTATLRKVLVE